MAQFSVPTILEIFKNNYHNDIYTIIKTVKQYYVNEFMFIMKPANHINNLLTILKDRTYCNNLNNLVFSNTELRK